MKNLLLILPLLFASSSDAAIRIDIIDYDADTKISVYCIGGYAFTSVRSKDNGDTSLTQIMRKHGPGGAMPMSCNEYMKTKPFKL